MRYPPVRPGIPSHWRLSCSDISNDIDQLMESLELSPIPRRRTFRSNSPLMPYWGHDDDPSLPQHNLSISRPHSRQSSVERIARYNESNLELERHEAMYYDPDLSLIPNPATLSYQNVETELPRPARHSFPADQTTGNSSRNSRYSHSLPNLTDNYIEEESEQQDKMMEAMEEAYEDHLESYPSYHYDPHYDDESRRYSHLDDSESVLNESFGTGMQALNCSTPRPILSPDPYTCYSSTKAKINTPRTITPVNTRNMLYTGRYSPKKSVSIHDPPTHNPPGHTLPPKDNYSKTCNRQRFASGNMLPDPAKDPSKHAVDTAVVPPWKTVEVPLPRPEFKKPERPGRSRFRDIGKTPTLKSPPYLTTGTTSRSPTLQSPPYRKTPSPPHPLQYTPRHSRSHSPSTQSRSPSPNIKPCYTPQPSPPPLPLCPPDPKLTKPYSRHTIGTSRSPVRHDSYNHHSYLNDTSRPPSKHVKRTSSPDTNHRHGSPTSSIRSLPRIPNKYRTSPDDLSYDYSDLHSHFATSYEELYGVMSDDTGYQTANTSPAEGERWW